MKKYLALTLLLFFLIACEKDEEDKMLTFGGIALFDDNGNPIGCYDQPCNDDWQNTPLSTEEMDYLTFSDVINVPSGNGPFNAKSPRFFPIPMSTNGTLFCAVGSSRAAKFKMALVSTDGIRRAFFATLVDQEHLDFIFENSFFADVPRGEAIRVFYAYYDENDVPVHTGYGDIGICTLDPPITNVEDCFE